MDNFNDNYTIEFLDEEIVNIEITESGPVGANGQNGSDGRDGIDGEAATIQIGTITTLPAGSDATVVNVGTDTEAIFNFGIPEGEKGDPGTAGGVTSVNTKVGDVSLTTNDIPDSTDKRYTTEAEKTKLSNTSGTNTGDETATTIKNKLGTSSATTDGYLTKEDWNTFNNKGSGAVTSVSGTSPIASSGGATPAISIQDATTSQKGAVQLSDSYTTDASTKATTEKALKDGLATKSDTGHNHSLANLTEKSYSSLTDKPTIPDELADLTSDATHRTVTDTEKNTWNGKQDALGFTPENSSNKVSSFQVTPDNTHYPTEKLVKDSLDGKQAAGTYVTSVGGSGAISSSGGTTPSISIADATTSVKGAVQLSNTYNGTSETKATTEKALSDGLATKQPTGSYLVAADISGKEDSSNKVTSISGSSTDTQYPSAKLLYDTAGKLSANVTYYIATTGSDVTGDGSSGSPWQTITKALNSIPKNLNGFQAIIKLNSGTYDNSSVIDISGFYSGALLIESLSGNRSDVTISRSLGGTVFYVHHNNIRISFTSITVICSDNSSIFYCADNFLILFQFIALGNSVSRVGDGIDLYSTNALLSDIVEVLFGISYGVVLGRCTLARTPDKTAITAGSTPILYYGGALIDNEFLTTPSTAPDSDYDVANKKYVDDGLAGKQNAGSYLTSESDTLGTVTGRGATTAVESEFTGGIKGLNHVKFNTNPTVGDFLEGKLYYDTLFKTLACNIDTDVTLQIGQEMQLYCYNNSGSPITNGSVVYISGGYNGYPTIALASAASEATSFVVGVVTNASIANGAYGLVTAFGHVNDLNTNSWNVGDVLYLDATTPGALTNTAPSAGGIDVKVARVMKKDSSTGRIFVNVRQLMKLTDLGDVTISTPTLDQVLRYNGTEWVNSNPVAASASSGISFFMDDTTILATGTNNDNEIVTLSKVPVTATSEVVDAISVTLATSPVLKEAYLYNTYLDRTSIDAGVWEFNTFASVSSVSGGRVSSIKRSIYTVKLGTGTLTTTGSGTTRTATASSGTPFSAGSVGSDKTNSGYVQTPNGLYQIVARTSDTVVTISTPTTYVNESAVSYNKWKYQFQTQTPTITSLTTNYSLYVTSVAQSAIAIDLTDKLGEIVFGISNNTTTINFTHNGTSHYSNFKTPLITLHGNLAGLQGGSGSVPNEEYYHLTSAQHTIVTQSASGSQDGYLTSANFNTFNGKIANVVEDTSPQLGGELDCQAHSVGFTEQDLTGDGTTTIDWKIGNKVYFTFGNSNETFTFTAPSKSCNLLLVLKQYSTGGKTATWPATVAWAGGTAPTLSTGNNAIDIVSFYYSVKDSKYYGVASLNFSVPI